MNPSQLSRVPFFSLLCSGFVWMLLPCHLFAQQSSSWTAGTGSSIYYNGGNVGVGLNNPLAKLHSSAGAGNTPFPGALIYGSTGNGTLTDEIGNSHSAATLVVGSNWTTNANGSLLNIYSAAGDGLLFVGAGGFTGIGTNSPRGNLDVRGEVIAMNRLTLAQDGGTATPTWHLDNTGGLFRVFWQPGIHVSGTDVMNASTSGNVGIGTNPTQYRLSVNGTIQAKEIIVNTGWADYVFQSGHRIAPLSEVAKFIETNHHLPGIPSEGEVKEKGIGVGDMQVRLLAKIEELTLHVIELQNRLLQLERTSSKR